MNWRKPIIRAALNLGGSKIQRYFDEIRRLEYAPEEMLVHLQQAKLERLLRHAYRHVPYYRETFQRIGLVEAGMTVHLEKWSELPVLTKKIFRSEFERLKSEDMASRRWYANSSGGSTGQPLNFIQDAEYRDWNYANKIFYKTFAGQQMGERELRVWGSDRDILEGRLSVRGRLQNWLYNRREFNAFRMTDPDMKRWVEEWRRFRPTWVEAYVQPIHEFARYVSRNRISLPAPKGILTSAGTLYPETRRMLKEVFGCPVFNRYGSREVGDAACSCQAEEGLHLSPWNQVVEILNDNFQPVSAGQVGRVFVTTLNNFSQPLIRYDIGDIAVRAEKERCSCGRAMPLIKNVEGREMSVFKTREGGVVPGEFFIHFIGVVFNEGCVDKFQVIQKAYDKIQIRVVVADRERLFARKAEIEGSIKKVMGEECRIEWVPVEAIESTSSGKYLYTICEIP